MTLFQALRDSSQKVSWHLCKRSTEGVEQVLRVSRTLPNWSNTVSSFRGSTSWKFFTDAAVTRPLKLRQYAARCSFQVGALLRRHQHFPRPRPALVAARMGAYLETQCFPVFVDGIYVRLQHATITLASAQPKLTSRASMQLNRSDWTQQPI